MTRKKRLTLMIAAPAVAVTLGYAVTEWPGVFFWTIGAVGVYLVLGFVVVILDGYDLALRYGLRKPPKRATTEKFAFSFLPPVLVGGFAATAAILFNYIEGIATLETSMLSIAVALVPAIYMGANFVRAINGDLGDNPAEAAELMSYMLERSKRGEPPSGPLRKLPPEEERSGVVQTVPGRA